VVIPESYFQTVQKACLPGVWSKGVALARDGAVIEDSRDEEEIRLRVKVAGRPVSPRVTLWPGDEDWFCDCGDRNELCMHIAAAVVALKNGLAQSSAESGDSESSKARTSAAGIEYRFRREDGALALDRWIVKGGSENGREVISGSLVSFAGGVASGRIAAPAVPATREDFAIDQLLAPAGQAPSGPLVRARDVLALFKLLKEVPVVRLEDQPIRVSSQPVKLQAELIDDGPGFRLRQIRDPQLTEAFRNGIVLHAEVLKPWESPELSSEQKQLLRDEGTFFAKKDVSHLVSDILPALENALAVEIKSKRLPRLVALAPRIALRLEEEALEVLGATASIVYGDPAIAELSGNRLISLSADTIPVRDPASERILQRDLSNELHLGIGERVKFEGLAAVEFARKATAFVERTPGGRVHGGGTTAFTVKEVLRPQLEISEDGRRFELEFPGADPARVFRAWQAGESFVPLLSGGWAPLPQDWLARYGDRVLALLEARRHSPKGELPAYRLPELAEFCEEIGNQLPAGLRLLREILERFESIPEAPLPGDLRAELRVYQRQGINWLSFLREAGMGALLADDMGLGKTLQALSVIRGRTLVVAPTSVLSTWREQAERFRPGLSSALYYGADREIDEKADLLITSYGVLRLDQELLGAREWDTVILDEAQTIKNPDSQVARAAHRLQGKFRIALSGTPVENHLTDLWSQFQFLNPGLLGSRDEFQERFSGAVERGERGAAEALRRRIKPFLLRRLKRDVAKELPPRTETVLHCELSVSERETYDGILAATRAEALRALEAGEGVLAVLEALLRLRQASCHPALVPGQKAETSSKLELFVETLLESIDNGHRALVFSQWTSFLDLLEPRLAREGIRFSRLDGSTRDRGAVVEEFQRPDGPTCMLISLKAGGVGLTLTAADHVFILDPWWNPAAENQAADRAHRIGQENPVLIHRLVARGTVEDRILELQKRKLALAGSVLEGSAQATSLTREDLMALLG
jgi:superfamily II DNA or RNA helicase